MNKLFCCNDPIARSMLLIWLYLLFEIWVELRTQKITIEFLTTSCMGTQILYQPKLNSKSKQPALLFQIFIYQELLKCQPLSQRNIARLLFSALHLIFIKQIMWNFCQELKIYSSTGGLYVVIVCIQKIVGI